MNDLRNILKSETRDCHELSEQRLADLVSPNLSIARYVHIVNHFSHFYGDFETRIDDLRSVGNLSSANFYTIERKKYSKLFADLKSISHQETETKPVVFNWSFLKDEFIDAQLWGMLYVIEGSTLGGQYIYKSIQNILGLDKNRGASFFSGYGDQTSMMWKHFLTELSNFQESLHFKEAVEAARWTFETLSRVSRIVNETGGAIG